MTEPYSPEFGRSWDKPAHQRGPAGPFKGEHSQPTMYGFEWGPMKVERLAHIEGRGYSLSVRTDHGEIQIYVSEKGQSVRAFVPGRGEMFLVDLEEL